MKRVTLQDIADELGISRNTVSKAINNSDGRYCRRLWRWDTSSSPMSIPSWPPTK